MGARDVVFGIVGGGKAGKNLALALDACSSGRVKVICTRHRQTAKEAAKAACVPEWTTDYQAVLDDRHIDAVIVATPDEYHCRQVVRAAGAKKHVLCEKPMCRSLNEADRMIHEAEKNRVILGDKGVLKIDFMSQPLTSFTPSGHSLVDSTTWPSSERGVGGAILAEVEHFIACIQHRRAPMTSGIEGRRAIEIALAAREAASTGKAVQIGQGTGNCRNLSSAPRTRVHL